MNLLLVVAAHPLTATDPSIGASLLKMVLGLGGVIISILAVSKVLQYLRRGTPQRKAAGSLEVLSRQSLGKGLQLAVVRFNGREVLVGIAGQQISFHEPANAGFDDEVDLFAAEQDAPGTQSAAGRGLASALAGLAERRSGATSAQNRASRVLAGQIFGAPNTAGQDRGGQDRGGQDRGGQDLRTPTLNGQPFSADAAALRGSGASVLDRLRDATTRR